MLDPIRAPVWQIVGGSVRGASHTRSGLPNQDAMRWLPGDGVGATVIIAVADGHGSARCFRSDQGAALAVLAATEALTEFADGLRDLPSLSAVKRAAEERLPQEIERRWKEAVDADLADHPLTDEELGRLEERDGARSRERVLATPRLTYGATLLSALLSADFLLFLQLGDGDILVVGDDGAVTRPVPGDSRLFANETTSLAGNDAWRDMRIGFTALAGLPPALALLATDGYANSFRDDAGFLQVGADLLTMIGDDGLDAVAASLPTWLAEASEAGSGDDITLVLASRL